MTNCWPSRSDSHCPIKRAMMSVPPAGAKPTMMRTASGRLAPTRCATRPAARQHRLPDAEIVGGEVSFEPPSGFTSLDHLVGGHEQHRRHGEAQRLRGLQIDDELELARSQHRQIGRLLALEDFGPA